MKKELELELKLKAIVKNENFEQLKEFIEQNKTLDEFKTTINENIRGVFSLAAKKNELIPIIKHIELILADVPDLRGNEKYSRLKSALWVAADTDNIDMLLEVINIEHPRSREQSYFDALSYLVKKNKFDMLQVFIKGRGYI